LPIKTKKGGEKASTKEKGDTPFPLTKQGAAMGKKDCKNAEIYLDPVKKKGGRVLAITTFIEPQKRKKP